LVPYAPCSPSHYFYSFYLFSDKQKICEIVRSAYSEALSKARDELKNEKK